jgi:ATP-binding protein involved in chromosome partitioning
MSTAIRESVIEILRKLPLPDAGDFTAADALVDVTVTADETTVTLSPGYPLAGAAVALEQAVRTALQPLGITKLSIALDWQAPRVRPGNQRASIDGVKNIIAVASGKGGVGKSTTSVNLALALVAEGARVGILDADIYGPSQAQMLGMADKRPEMHAPNMMEPIKALGLKCISMGNLVTEKTPMVWRGPMVSGALQQLLNNTHWGDIDYLIVDMPPGTGDIQLTLSQSVPVSAAVIVTTPQDIALLDARKGIEMFRKVNIPVLGVVENMSLHTCTHCGHTEAIFGEQGGERLAEEYDVRLLGQLPLRADIRQQTDAGKPPVAENPDSDVSQIYRSIARQVAAGLWRQSRTADAAPEISIEED